MFWTLLTAIFAGLGGGGIGLALRKLSGNRLPAGVVPVAAGIAMIVSTVALEYSWFPNNLDDLPEDTVILSTREQQAVYQPWTYVQPWVRGFVAFAPSENVETAENSEVFVVQAHVRERWQPAMIRPVLVDCAGMRRGDIGPETEFDDAGQPIDMTWVAEGDEDEVVTTICTHLAPSG